MKTVLHWLLVAAAFAYMSWQAPMLAHSADEGLALLPDLSWGWVALSALLALGAVAAYAELHRELLAVGRAQVPVGTVQSITFVENAINNTLPVVGGAAGLAYAISRFRRRHVDAALASWAVLLAGVLTTLCLIALAAVALAATGRMPVAVAVLAVVAIVAGAAGCWVLVMHPARLQALLRPVLSLSRFVPGQCRTCRDHRTANLEQVTTRVTNRLALLQPTPVQWLTLVAVAVSTWVLDFAGLTAAAAAAISPVPWQSLVLGFLVVQASIALQIFPGGAGLAEVGLLGAMLSTGVAPGPAAATVLIYRGASWLLPSVLGWIAYGVQIHVIRAVPHMHHAHPAVG